MGLNYELQVVTLLVVSGLLGQRANCPLSGQASGRSATVAGRPGQGPATQRLVELAVGWHLCIFFNFFVCSSAKRLLCGGILVIIFSDFLFFCLKPNGYLYDGIIIIFLICFQAYIYRAQSLGLKKMEISSTRLFLQLS